MSKYGVFSAAYFPAFALNTERYEVSLCIQSKCGKIRTRKKLRIWTHFTQSFITEIHLNSLQTSCLTTSKKCAVGNATSIRAFKFSYCKITNQLKVPYRVKNISPFEGIITKNDKFRVYRGVIIYRDKQRKINNSDNLKSLRLSIT